MATRPKVKHTEVYEFKPQSDITNNEIIELCNLIRIGVSGDVLSKASDELKKHFFQRTSTKAKKAA